jgi:protein SCO1/2
MPKRRSPVALEIAAFSLLAITTSTLGSADPHDHSAHDHSAHDQSVQAVAPANDEHAAHRAQLANVDTQVSQQQYAVPDVRLEDSTGKTVRLRDVLAGDRPVAVNFIFTSCTTICPVMTATMLQTQHHLADETTKPEFVSITIDPDFDDAATLQQYAARYGAKWTFLTGTRADVVAVLKAFDAYRGAKANHIAVTLLRAPNAEQWTRVEGLASANQLANLWRDISS